MIGFDKIIAESIRKVLLESEQDDLYAKAYRENDTDTAMRMVRIAAKEKMPNTKVVDGNGEPMAVYHGSTKQFNSFDKKKSSNYFYFTDELSVANVYKGDSENGMVFKCFVNIEKPKIFDIYGYTFAGVKATWNIDENSPDNINKGRKYAFAYMESVIARRKGHDGLVLNNVSDWGSGGKWDFLQNQYIVFEPHQIKSAEPFTFDDSGNLIPLSQRFDFSKNDIRY